MKEKELIKKSGIYSIIILFAISIFWFLFSIQSSFGYSGTGTTQDLKSGSRINGDLLAQPFNGSVTIFFGTQSTSILGTGTAGYIGTNTTGLPKLKYSYTGGASTIDFIGFGAVKIEGLNIPSSGSVTGKIDAVGGTGTANILTDTTLAGQGTITGTYRANGVNISPAEYASVDNATGEIQAQITTITGSITNHTHGGTDTVKIAHSNLLNPGTNTHTIIDTFIDSKASASGLASLDSDSKVVQNPASGTSTPGTSKTVMSDGTGKIADGWLSTNIPLVGTIELGTDTTGNADNITEGSTNKYYTDSRVNSAVGSLTLNQLLDTKNLGSITTGQFVKRVGTGYEGGAASVIVGWPDINTGTLTGNTDISGTPTANKLVMSTSTNLNNWILGTLTISAIQATSTANTFGTTTQRNNSMVTISNLATSTLSVVSGYRTGTNTTAIMTGTNTPSPNRILVSSTYSGDYSGYEAFDGVISGGAGNGWSTSGNTNEWIEYDYGTGTQKAIKELRITANIADNGGSAAAPVTFDFRGSQDRITYTSIDARSGQSFAALETKTYTIATSTTAYQFYRLHITSYNGYSSGVIGELQLIEMLGNLDSLYVNDNGIVLIATTTVSSTSTAYAFQIGGSGLAISWGVTCYEDIKSIVGSGFDVIEEGYNAVMGTKLFKHHPKIRNDITLQKAEEVAKTEYVKSFESADYETFKTDRIAEYLADKGTDTANWTRLKEDFASEYVLPRQDEFYVLPDKDKRVRDKKVELESDTSITSITPVSDNPSTPDLFKRGDSRILDLQPQIGCLQAAAQYQDAEIQSLIAIIGSLTSRIEKAGIP